VEAPVVEDPVLRQRYAFRREAAADGGEILHVETWVRPGGGVTPHFHPAMHEEFEILEGNPHFLAGRKWRRTAPGETVVVPAGTRHAYRNRSDQIAHFIAHVRPPSLLREFLEDVARLSRARKITRYGLPRGLSGLLQGMVLAHHYREMAVLLFPPLPPPALQRVLVPPLAHLAGRRGYRAGNLGAAVR
jgi:quercetin dioxygenase-like cupin family protein